MDDPTLRLEPDKIRVKRRALRQGPPPLEAGPPLRPLKKMRAKRGRSGGPTRLALKIFLGFVLVMCALLGVGYYYFRTAIEMPIQGIIHSVSRGNDEPPVNDGAVLGRTWNILLMGSDNDGKYNFPALLTQVMMIVHIDTNNNSVTMVSIPRDSWVSLPDIGGMHKIDQAFFLGVTHNKGFDDGVRQARLTIEKDYGITIDRYAWVGLSGFAKVIDTLGGVDIDVAHPVVDDTYPDDTAGSNDPYGYKRLDLVPGPQHLNGEQALDYVRSRHADLVGDIGRTQRQQQVLDALKKKLNLSSVVNNLSQLIKDIQGQVYTDLSESEMLAFANFGRTLQGKDIHRITLGPGQGSQDYGDYGTVYDPSAGSNQSVIIPNCDNIQPTLNNIFGGSGLFQTCNVSGTG